MKREISIREEEMLNFFWDRGESMTAREVSDILFEENWNSVTVFKTIQKLSESGLLKVTGLKRACKMYARELYPSLSKTDFYANILVKNHMDDKFIVSFARICETNSEKNSNKEVIDILQKVVNDLRQNIE